MSQDLADRVTIRVRNSTPTSLTLVLEPVADEYQIAANGSLDVVENGGNVNNVLEIELHEDRLTLFARGRAAFSVRSTRQ